MRLLAVDFGERRVGLAISDEAEEIAVPLTTLRRSSDRRVIGEIRRLVEREGVGALVVGEPRLPDGSEGEAAQRARTFAAKLAAATGLDCTLVDECLTSHEARRRLREAGIDPRRDPGRVDQVAAQILLEEALAQRKGVG